VPPLLGRAVARELIRAMGVRPKKPKTELALGDERLLYIDMVRASSRYGVPADTIAKRSRPEARDGEPEKRKRRQRQPSSQLGLGL
jgi:DNA (cytosine-5)-methyltransferase 1